MISSYQSDPINSTPHAPSRYSWVDAAKGIGIVLVVYGHVSRGLQSAGVIHDSASFRLVDSIIYSFHMPLFFFLSGIFLSSSLQRRGFKGLLVGKIETLIYPYVLWSLMQGSLEAALSKYTNGAIGWSDVLSLAWMPRAQFWFLYVLFFTFVISGAAFSARTAVKIGFSLLTVALHVCSSTLPDAWIVQPLAVNSVFFVAGSWFLRIEGRISRNSKKWLFVSAAVALTSEYLIHETFDQTYTETGLMTLVAGIGCISTITAFLMQLEPRLPRFVVAIGASSMSIFLMHVLAGSGTRIILGKILGIDSAIVHIIAGVSAGILFPMVAENLIRRFNLGFLLEFPRSRRGEKSPSR
ncbi:acyltransferase family protein [Stenotrophomonas geniculata]|uniref:acyltransferase family protein n=1 Tax=Stenotrophomonas geniculata TaxID=86188 RepID=UPI0037528423